MHKQELPNGWQLVRLNKLLKKVRRSIEVQPDEMYSQIGIRSFGKGIFHKEPVSGEEIGSKRVYWIEPGDFVLNIVFAWEGAVALASEDERGYCGSHRFPTFEINKKRLNPEYLLNYFKSHDGLVQLMMVSPGGAGRNKTLNQSDFLKLRIPLPPLDKQNHIVRVLRDADENIAAVDAQIADAQEIKRGAMQELFSKDRQHGNLVHIDDFLTLEYGASLPERNRIKGKYPVISSGGFIDTHNEHLIQGPGIVIGRKGSIGQVYWSATDFYPIDTAYYVKQINPNVNLLWIYYLLDYLGLQKMNAATGVPSLNRESVYDLKVRLPPMNEQCEIAAILQSHDDTIRSLQAERDELREVKRGLMQQLLSGEVRV